MGLAVATMKLAQFFLNKDEKGETDPETPVATPAFSLTKVLGAGAVIITPLATILVNAINKNDFQPIHYVMLAIALLGFLAITSAADVLARGIASGAQSYADASGALADTSNMIKFDEPLEASYVKENAHKATDITVLAALGGNAPHYLVQEGDVIKWMPVAEVKVPR